MTRNRQLTRKRSMSRLTQPTPLTRRNIHGRNPRHTRNINHSSRILRTRALEQQWLHTHRHIKNILHIQIIQLIPRMFRIIVIIIAPTRTRIIHQHSQPVRTLLELVAQRDAARFVFEICDDVFAGSGAQCVEPRGRGFELGFFARGDEDAGSVLYEGLGGHFAEAGRTAGDEDDVRGEVEERGDAEVVFGGGVRHGCGWDMGVR
jgi:hypothetical protein